jgi:hypothetical protein
MICLYSLKSAAPLVIALASMISLGANATLLECNENKGVLLSLDCQQHEPRLANDTLANAMSAAPTNVNVAEVSGFQLKEAHTGDVIPDSIFLIGLICALLGVVLVRAKRFNSK